MKNSTPLSHELPNRVPVGCDGPAGQNATHTPLPWGWHIEDYSTAYLQGPNGEYGHVLTVHPCSSCIASAKRAGKPKWVWGRCTTPSEADAALIVSAVNAHPSLVAALEAAAKMIPAARQHFPKSMHNPDRFALELTCAQINKALQAAKEGA